MPTNFELERLKPKLDIFKIHENRVHELTDSNVSPAVIYEDQDGVKGVTIKFNHYKIVTRIIKKIINIRAEALLRNLNQSNCSARIVNV